MYKFAVGALALLCWCGSSIAGYGFAPPVRILDEVRSAATVVGDMNGDGRQDIVMLTTGPTQTFDRKLAVIYQRADGTFFPPQVHDFGWVEFPLNGPYLSLADMDADGDLDVVATTGDGDGRIVILRNNQGGFSWIDIAGAEFSDLDIADVNGDGRPDVITKLVFSSTAAIYFGDGLGGFDGSSSVVLVQDTGKLHFVDIDGDSRRDLVYATQLYAYMHRHEGDRFSAVATKLVALDGETSAPTIDFGDLNEDGRVDIVADVFLRDGSPLWAYLQEQGGTFRKRPVSVGISKRGAVLAVDIDGDAFEDLMVLRSYPPSPGVSVRLGQGNGSFAEEVSLSLDLQPGTFNAVADFNADGFMDILNSKFDIGTFVHFGRGSPSGADLAITLKLLPDNAAVQVRNLGNEPSQAFSIDLKIIPRIGGITPGAIPAGCEIYDSSGRVHMYCRGTASLAPGQSVEIALPFALADPARHNRISATAKIYTPIQDLRPDNDRDSTSITVRAAQLPLAGRGKLP